MYSQVLSNEIKTTLFNTFCEKKYFNSLWIKFVFATLHSSSLQFPTFVIPQGRLYFEYLSHRLAGGRKLTADQIWSTWIFKLLARHYDWFIDRSIITRNMGQDGDGHVHFDQIWRPNITINYMGVDQNIKF
jgi:hypothetical protein